jgi:MerR family Zn(II)-responsive transcriptional regulator of zntA
MKDIYSIGELVKQLNINKETIRYYERIGLISETTRDKNGYRIYTKEDMGKIKFILIVKNFGFSLKEISMLIHDEIICEDIKSIRKIVEDKVNEINNKINQLDATKRLLEKVKKNILDENIKCCDDIEKYLKK